MPRKPSCAASYIHDPALKTEQDYEDYGVRVHPPKKPTGVREIREYHNKLAITKEQALQELIDSLPDGVMTPSFEMMRNYIVSLGMDIYNHFKMLTHTLRP